MYDHQVIHVAASRTVTAHLWKCPNEECPPVDHHPYEVITFERDGVKKGVCAGECRGTYPWVSFRRVTATR
jgi:hypothetical protein